jgi:triphosphoribosyl-dephospho-CoA synthetase
MDEARAVLERLDRIEDITDRDELIAELRELVREVEVWVRKEVVVVGAAP